MADQPTPQQIEALATPDDDSVSAAPTSADLLGVSAFYGNPKIQGSKGRQASSDSNQQAAMLGPSLARGAVAGLGGIPGDAESLVRLFLNNYVDENGNKQGLNLYDKTVLPTTGDLNDYLPGKTAGGMNALATGVGNLIGPGMAGDVVKGVGALGKYMAPAVGDALDAYHTTAGGKAFAVKPPGGNWASDYSNLTPVIENLQGSAFEPEAKQWVGSKLQKYIKNNLGTANDPLAAAPHIPPDILNARGPGYAFGAEDAEDAVAPTQYTGGTFSDPDSLKHMALTGRVSRTPWEQVSDSHLNIIQPQDHARMLEGMGKPVPPWLSGPNAQPVHDLMNADWAPRELGLDHIVDYLNEATTAGSYLKQYGSSQAIRDAFGGTHPTADLIDRNLHINPADLSKMSVSDVANKTGAWNDYLAAQQSKATRQLSPNAQVLKQYDDGHQWVQLAPEDLKGEGASMGHCVGGYCSSVEGGNTKILSLRDAKGDPHVTVELSSVGKDPLIWAGHGAVPNPGESWDQMETLEKQLRASPEYKQYLQEQPWQIRQIKGKGNAAPVAAYQPAVQDLVKNMGPWRDNVGDLQNTGLVDTAAWGKRNGVLHPPDTPRFMTKEEHNSLLKRQGYASGGSVQAPTVSGPQTVGLAQFAGANDVSGGATGASTGGQSGDPTGFLSGAGSSIGSSTPTTSSSSTPYYGDSNSFWNNVGGGSLPQPISDSTAPTFNANTQFGHDFLSDTINSMGHKGGILQGMDALVGAYEPYTPASGEGATEAGPQAGSGTWNTQQLINGAKQFGIDLSNYDLNPADQQLGMRAGIGAGVPMVPGVAHPANGEGGIADAANSFNNQTANYRTLAGASAGWDGSGNARSGSRELYQVQPDGTWLPVNQPVPFAIPKTGDWAHQNADLVSAISVMLPAVGGWAGLLGQTGATAGLTGGALTAANAGINALGTAALGGNPITGLAGAAGGYLGGLAGVSPTLGSMAGSQLAKYFTTPSANSPSAAQAIPVPAPVVNTPQTLPNIGSYFTTPAKQ